MPPPNLWKFAFFGLSLVMAAALAALAVFLRPIALPNWDYVMFGWSVVVALFGAAIGFSELIARYKDNPLQSLLTWSAGLYVAVNMSAAVLAYILIRYFDLKFGAPAAQLEWVRAMVAGFGAMVFFRSSLFQAKIGDTSVAIGPGVVFQILLAATDRACDRKRGEVRSVLARDLMQNISFTRAKLALPSFCFGLMQNISAEEQTQVGLVISSIATLDMDDVNKAYRLGLLLLNLVGENALRSAVTTLGAAIREPAKLNTLDIDSYPILQRMNFKTQTSLLISTCFTMSAFDSDKERITAKQAAIQKIAALGDLGDLDNGAAMTLVGLTLQQTVGNAVLRAALAQLSSLVPKPDAAASGNGKAPAPKVDPSATPLTSDVAATPSVSAGDQQNVVTLHADIEPADDSGTGKTNTDNLKTA